MNLIKNNNKLESSYLVSMWERTPQPLSLCESTICSQPWPALLHFFTQDMFIRVKSRTHCLRVHDSVHYLPRKSYVGHSLCGDFAKVLGLPQGAHSIEERDGGVQTSRYKIMSESSKYSTEGTPQDSHLCWGAWGGTGCLKHLLKEVALGGQQRHVCSACELGEGHVGWGNSVFRSKEVGSILEPLDMSTCGNRVLFPGTLGRKILRAVSHCMKGAEWEPKRSAFTQGISFL